MDLVTKRAETLVFKPDGRVHSTSPIRGIGTVVSVTGSITPIEGRGPCYRRSLSLSFLYTNAYVSVNDLALAGSTPPPPPSPGVERARIILTEADGRQRAFDEVL